MSIDQFLKAAWSDHGDQPEQVAHRLAESLYLVDAPDHAPAFVNLLTHVYGEHLGQWGRGIDLLKALRGESALAESALALSSIVRGIAALRYASGEPGVLESLGVEDQVRALAIAFSALAARQDFRRAMLAFELAHRAAQSGLPPGSPALRAMAACANNLAVALEAKPDRAESETGAMVASAEAALHYWKLAGTWLEEERAEYRFARSLLQAGQAALAVKHSHRCLQVCEQSGAPPFEMFFAHAVTAVAHRAAGEEDHFQHHRALALNNFQQVADAERQWCESDLRQLEG